MVMPENPSDIHDNETPPEVDTPADIDVQQVEDLSEVTPEDERVAELMSHTIDVPVLAEAVQQQEAADAADTLEDLEDEEAADVLELMEDQAAADALAEMEGPLAAIVLDDLVDEQKADYAAQLLHLMAPDDAADLLQELDTDEQREALLQAMPVPEATNLRRLAGYDEDTAAGLMTTDYLALSDSMTVAQATEIIRGRSLSDEINDLLITAPGGKLAGMISLRALLLNRPEDRIDDLMNRSIKAVRADLDREDVAREFDRYDFSMLPVIDQSDRLLGIITVDDIIDIIREEQTEDVQKTVGAGAEEAVYSPLTEKFRGRFPWLSTSLVLTSMAAIIAVFFDELVGERPILAFLMLLIAALVGNAGHQALAVTLRGIVLDEVRRDRVLPLILREGAVGFLQGLALGIMVLLVVWALSFISNSASWEIGAVAGFSLAISMGVGTLAGSSIPLIMRGLRFDPAQSSAIILIVITDGVALSTFLGLIYAFSPWLPMVSSGMS